jgi:uncharacterized phage-associated protein
MAMLTAQEVARWFLIRNNVSVRQFDGELLTHLKIQKLLYYAQGLFLAYTNGKELFNEEIYAWEHGPVVREVYDVYKSKGSNIIEYTHEPSDDVLLEKVSNDEDIRNILEATFVNYGKYSAWRLREMTHEEIPWKTTALNGVIEKAKIGKYFSEEVLES